MTEPHRVVAMRTHRPRRPRRAWLAPLMLIVVVVICCGGVFGLGAIVRGLTEDESQAPVIEAASAYLDDLVDADYSSAYKRLCDADRAQRTLAEFSQQPEMSRYRITGVTIKYPEERSAVAVIEVEVTDANGERSVRYLNLSGGAEGWIVCQADTEQPAS